MRIIVTGIVGQYAFGGVAWDYLQYLEGFRYLGRDAWYLEDTETWKGYVKSRSGWFSCRSACYLALGRPCVLQDTGWSNIYPTGDGLFAFDTIEEAVAGIEEINADYAHHFAEARALAEREFHAGHVLSAMLEDTGP